MEQHKPATIHIVIETGNDAFTNPNEVAAVLARASDELATRDMSKYSHFWLHDTNGNRVGFCDIKPQ